MICKRCGSECPERPEGYCFHCLVGLGAGLLDKKNGKPIEGVREGFPDWQNPHPLAEYNGEELEAEIERRKG